MQILEIIAANIDLLALLFLLLFVVFFILFTYRATRGARVLLRPNRLYARFLNLAAQAVETGRPIHLGMGIGSLSGGIGANVGTAESFVALAVFATLADRARGAVQPLQGTTADGTVLAAALGIVHRRDAQDGQTGPALNKAVRFYGPDPLAYAAGVRQTLAERRHLANVLLGYLGAEGLWIAETNIKNTPAQLGGTTPPASSALLAMSLDQMVIGEDVFAAGAYLGRIAHLGSLVTQDLMRIVIILSILVGVILASLGYWV
jgi:hypothetical protein